MNTILNLFKPEVIKASVRENQDPVPSFIDKLSSAEDLKIKIQTNNDNIVIQNKKKFDSLSIPYDGNKKSCVRKNLVRPRFQKPDELRCLLSL